MTKEQIKITLESGNTVFTNVWTFSWYKDSNQGSYTCGDPQCCDDIEKYDSIDDFIDTILWYANNKEEEIY